MTLNIYNNKYSYRESINNTIDEDSDNAIKSDEDSSPVLKQLSFNDNYYNENETSPSSLISKINIKSSNYRQHEISLSNPFSTSIKDSNDSSCKNNYNFPLQSNIERINSWNKITNSNILPVFKQNSNSSKSSVYQLCDNLSIQNQNSYGNLLHSNQNVPNFISKNQYLTEISMNDANENVASMYLNNSLSLMTSNTFSKSEPVTDEKRNSKKECLIEQSNNCNDTREIRENRYNHAIKLYLIFTILIAFITAYYIKVPQISNHIKDFDIQDIVNELNDSLFGQNLAINEISHHMNKFIQNNSKQVLLLSFQGSSGTGKSLTSFILSSYFKQIGEVMNYIIPVDFVDSTKTDGRLLFNSLTSKPLLEPYLQHIVRLVIIDEMDAAGDFIIAALISAIECLDSENLENINYKSYLSIIYNYIKYIFSETTSNDDMNVDGKQNIINNYIFKLKSSCRINKSLRWKTVIILVSQKDSNEINTIFFQLAKNNISRSSIDQKHFGIYLNSDTHQNHLRKKNSFDADSSRKYEKEYLHGDWDKLTFDAIIPFLPLERSQIKQCLNKIMINKFQYSEEQIEKILDTFDYYTINDLKFSFSGCKKVSRQIDLEFDE